MRTMRKSILVMFVVVMFFINFGVYADHAIESAVSTTDISASTGVQAGAISTGNSFNTGVGIVTKGIANSDSFSKGMTSSFNEGLSASLKGGSIAKSSADASGISIGFRPINISRASVSGTAEQMQQGTVQVGNTFASGGNQSLAQYNGIQDMNSNGCLLAVSGVQANGIAVTKGITELSINPNISASAFTGNMALSQTVQGQGSVGIGVLNQTNSSYAMVQGNAGFNYSGTGVGFGLAYVNGNVVNTGNRASATITGGSVSY